MRFTEAMRLVLDYGRIVARESRWVRVAAGFSWGPWVFLGRELTADDIRRHDEGDSGPFATGPLVLSWSDLCRTHVGVKFSDFDDAEREADDWVDVTDRFECGVPLGYLDWHYGAEAAADIRAGWGPRPGESLGL